MCRGLSADVGVDWTGLPAFLVGWNGFHSAFISLIVAMGTTCNFSKGILSAATTIFNDVSKIVLLCLMIYPSLQPLKFIVLSVIDERKSDGVNLLVYKNYFHN